MKSLKQRIQKSSGPKQQASPRTKKKDLTWTHNDQSLWQAVSSNQPTKVVAKLSKHANVDVNKICPNVGYSVVHFACAKGLDDCLNILLAHNADAGMRDVTGATPLHAAARYGHKGTTSKLLVSRTVQLNAGDNNRCTALHFAAYEGHLDVVRLLVERAETEVDATDKDNRTPFMVAACMGRFDVCQKLMGHGAKINALDRTSHTALMLAAENGHEDVVRLLCENGSTLDVTTSDGKTALDLAKRSKRQNVVDVLHVAQLKYDAKSSGHGERLSSLSKYTIDDTKRTKSTENIFKDTYIDDMVAGTHYTNHPTAGKHAPKNAKSTIAKVKAAAEAMKHHKGDKSHRGSNASSSVSTPQPSIREGDMAIYAAGHTGTLYDRENKYYDSQSSLDGSMYSAVISKSMDSLDNHLHEVPHAKAQAQTTAFVKRTREVGAQTTVDPWRDLERQVAQYSAAANQQKMKRKEEANRNQKLSAMNSELQNEVTTLQTRMSEQMQMLAEQRSKYLRMEAERDEVMKTLDDEVTRRKEAEEKYHEASSNIAQLLKKMQHLEELQQHETDRSHQQTAADEDRIRSTESALTDAKMNIEDLEQRLKEAQLFGDKSQSRIAELEDAVIAAERAADGQSDASAQRVLELEARVSKLDGKVIRWKKKYEEAEAQSRSAQTKLSETHKSDDQRIHDLQSTCKQLENELKQSEDKINKISSEKFSIEGDLEEESSRRQALEHQLKEALAVRDETNKELDITVETNDKMKQEVTSLSADKKQLEEQQKKQLRELSKMLPEVDKANIIQTDDSWLRLRQQVELLTAKVKSASQKSPRSKKLQDENEQLVNKCNSQQATIAEQEKTLKELNERVTSLETSLLEKSKENQDTMEQLYKTTSQLRGHTQSTISVQKQLNDANKELADLRVKTSAERSKREGQVDELKTKLQQTEREMQLLMTEFEAKLKKAESEQRAMQVTVATKEQDAIEMRTLRNNAEARANDAHHRVKQAEEKRHDFEVEANRLRQNLTDVRQKCDKMNDELNVLRKSRRDLTLRLNAKETEDIEAGRQRVDALARQLEALQETLTLSEQNHRDTINTYRGHLLSAVKGDLDPQISSALQEIIKQRSVSSNKTHGSHI